MLEAAELVHQVQEHVLEVLGAEELVHHIQELVLEVLGLGALSLSPSSTLGTLSHLCWTMLDLGKA